MSDEAKRHTDDLHQRPAVRVVVVVPGFDHPGGVFHKVGDVIEVTGPEAVTFLGQGKCTLAD